jgi:small ligand-binding sensory domain FIST
MNSAMEWASTVASTHHLSDAMEQCCEGIAADLSGPPDLLIAFASPDYQDHFGRLPSLAADVFPQTMLLGCSAGGVIGGGQEIEQESCLALVGARLPDVRLHAFHIDDDPGSWGAAIPLDPETDPDFIVLADPFSCDTQTLIRWLDSRFPESIKIGGLASGSKGPGDSALFVGDLTVRSGAVALAMTGNIEVDTIVAQGCRPIGEPLFVTQTMGPLITEIDGNPALPVLEALFSELGDEDQKLFRDSLFVGTVMESSREHYGGGDFLIRNIMGIDVEHQGLLVDMQPTPKQVIQFHLRDASSSAENLDAVLSRHRYAAPAGALLFSCLGRGQSLYGRSGLESEAFRNAMGDVPLGGFFGNGEIGPVRGRTFLHGYTSAFGLFRPKRS